MHSFICCKTTVQLHIVIVHKDMFYYYFILCTVKVMMIFRMATLRAEPADIQFCEMKQDERSNTENTVRNTHHSFIPYVECVTFSITFSFFIFTIIRQSVGGQLGLKKKFRGSLRNCPPPFLIILVTYLFLTTLCFVLCCCTFTVWSLDCILLLQYFLYELFSEDLKVSLSWGSQTYIIYMLLGYF